MAEGKSIDSLFADLEGDETKIAGLLALTESTQFQDAVKQIDSAHVSPGRDVASMLGIDYNDRGFTTVSGAYDGAYTVMADPLLFAGPIGKAVQASKYGLSTPQNVEKVFSQKSVQRYAGGFMDEFAKLPEARIASLNKEISVAVDKAASGAPVGSEQAVAAFRSAVSAANNVYDTVSKAAKQAVEFVEANVGAAADATLKAVSTAAPAPKAKKAA